MRKTYIVIGIKQLKRLGIALLLSFLLIYALFAGGSYYAQSVHLFFPETPASSSGDYGEILAPAFAPTDGYYVFVDLDALTLYLYEDGEIRKSWPVSGGSKESPSPVGNWMVTGIGSWGEGFGGSWISLNVPWGKYGIHGTKEPWSLGSSNISHGCIRMKNSDAAALKKYLAYGTPVRIKYDGIPFRALKDGKFGSDVLLLQEMLKKLGYYNGYPDGRFGTGTRSAVIDFQKAKGIKADGIVGWHSWGLLKEDITALEQAAITDNPESRTAANASIRGLQ